MLDSKQENIARQFNIYDKIIELQNDLIKINGVIDVDFDLSGYYDNLNEIIFLTKYDITFKDRINGAGRVLINTVLEVAKKHELIKTGDRIEDYGEHFYFVFEFKRKSKWDCV